MRNTCLRSQHRRVEAAACGAGSQSMLCHQANADRRTQERVRLVSEGYPRAKPQPVLAYYRRKVSERLTAILQASSPCPTATGYNFLPILTAAQPS